MKFGSKKAIFGVILGGFEGFGPATPPTHIWERSPKKTFFFIPSLNRENGKKNGKNGKMVKLRLKKVPQSARLSAGGV